MPATWPASDPEGRPHLEPILTTLVAELSASAPGSLGHVDPARLLFVAAAARREARASVRPLAVHPGADPRWVKPRIVVGGMEVAYEIALRPLFFLAADPALRLRTLVHELWHLSLRFDGTLEPSRRHRSGGRFEGDVERIAARWQGSPLTRAWLEHRGEVRLRAWLRRPPSRIPSGVPLRTDYDQRDLYDAVLLQT